MKNNQNYLILIGIICAIVIFTLGYSITNVQTGNADNEDKIILRYGEVNPEGNTIVTTAHYFADEVARLSDGTIEVEIYPSGQLGVDDSQCLQALQMGGLDLYRTNGASLSLIGDFEVSALSLPYIFKDREHFWKVCQSELGRRILTNIQQTGAQMIGVCYFDEGTRNLFTSDRAITKLSDLKDKKIRVMPSGVLEDTLLALGADPVPMIYAELYNSLATKTVDGGENPVTSYYSNKYYEVAPYYSKDSHLYSPSILVMSEITWNHLTQNQKQIILQAGKSAEEYNRSEIDKAEKEIYRKLMAAGVTVTDVTDIEDWEAAMTPVYEKYGGEYLDLIEEIKNMQ